MEGDDLAIPEMSVDYCFLRCEGEEDVVNIFVVRDRTTCPIHAFRLECKCTESEAQILEQWNV
jgi:hypothetical protein